MTVRRGVPRPRYLAWDTSVGTIISVDREHPPRGLPSSRAVPSPRMQKEDSLPPRPGSASAIRRERCRYTEPGANRTTDYRGCRAGTPRRATLLASLKGRAPGPKGGSPTTGGPSTLTSDGSLSRNDRPYKRRRQCRECRCEEVVTAE